MASAFFSATTSFEELWGDWIPAPTVIFAMALSTME